MRKRYLFFVFFVTLAILLFSAFNLALAAEQTINFPSYAPYFNCQTHGFHQKEYCPPSWGWEFSYFADSFNSNYSAIYEINPYTFVGHRHGSSEVRAVVCLFANTGWQGPCGVFAEKGEALGGELTAEDSYMYNYYGSPPPPLTANNSPEANGFNIGYGSYVEDAEVRINGTGRVSGPDLPPPPVIVNLNFIVSGTCGPVSSATVNIDQDFGNGTSRITDGSGFANFGVWKNTNIGWSVSKNGYGSQNGNVNSGPNGTTKNVDLGNPPGVGNACTGATSPANACDQTNPGGAGTNQCNGFCSGTTGTIPANPPGYGNACPSSANVCGQTNFGTFQCNSTCSATIPPNSSCPAPVANISANPNPVSYGGASTISWSSTNSSSCSVPGIGTGLAGGPISTGALYSNQIYTITCTGLNGSQVSNSVTVSILVPTVDIKANNSNGPITLAWNSSANLSWTSTNAGSCNALGDWSGAKALNSSQSTGNLIIPKTYNYTLTCSGNGPASDSVQVILNPPIPNSPTNVTTTAPDYCVSGPAATITWTYSDLSGSSQSAYEVQMDEQGSFQDPEYQTGKVLTNSNSNFTGQGVLQFNKNYKTRVRVWNSYNVVSGWTTEPGNFDTPPYAYPQVDFYWTANEIQNNPSPSLNKPVVFTDQTVFNGNPNGREWDWLFGDGSSSILQNPKNTYTAEGTYYVTLTATDNANQVCSRTKGPLIIQKPIPRWREIAPR